MADMPSSLRLCLPADQGKMSETIVARHRRQIRWEGIPGGHHSAGSINIFGQLRDDPRETLQGGRIGRTANPMVGDPDIERASVDTRGGIQ